MARRRGLRVLLAGLLRLLIGLGLAHPWLIENNISANFETVFSNLIPIRLNYCEYSDNQREILRILILIKIKFNGNYWILGGSGFCEKIGFNQPDFRFRSLYLHLPASVCLRMAFLLPPVCS